MRELDPLDLLKIYQGQSIDFYRFSGNYGDSLIWHGTKILLSSLNIFESYVDLESPQHNKILFIDGGGNFVNYYNDVYNFLIKKSYLYEEIIILPHTIFGKRQIDLLNSIHGNLTVFCREKVSAGFVGERLRHGKSYLWHDCAFYNSFGQSPEGEGTLQAFRIDRESINKKIPNSNIDVSYNGYAKKPLNEFLETLTKYKQVDTDRLHVAIGAALLGKEVKLFPNSYYKNKEVFDYSLARFPKVSFVDSFKI